ncbi:uncharacterized protein LOC110238019 [Exaiptasia diaphana]|uniref:Uncharacterized protein n=1 Tax=Exaiptasia diaphana TaxID=2652724 RepID=A0A913YHS9_EXADI|nr:uncharacterized protein LOC110238019 [Exaiptasia diaphana]KXJ15025.1 hypothetical protein AC249_AIPGENE6545 [Exaiptasia diaphana]
MIIFTDSVSNKKLVMALFSLVFVAVICIGDVYSYEATECEKKYVSQCTEEFKNVWKSSGENEILRDVYCRAYKTMGRCLTTDSKDCAGNMLDITRMLIVEHMLLDKRARVCPDHDIEDFKKLVEAHLDGKVTSKHIKKVDSDKMEPCAVKVSHECADSIARIMLHNFKKENACVAPTVEKIFECYESKVENCDADIFHDVLDTFKQMGKLTTDMATNQHALNNCDR